MAICDGMGGEQDGEIAAYIAVKQLKAYQKRHPGILDSFNAHINMYVKSANYAMCEYMKNHEGIRMGSTVSILCIHPQKHEAVAGNVGDSKAFLFRSQKLKKLSEDHNEAQSMVALGIITEEESRTHKAKSTLTQHLGIFQEEMVIEPFVSDTVMLKQGDIFLLCSDGLTDMLAYQDIEMILQKKGKLLTMAKRLVKQANANGGKDNVTVLMAKVV